MNEVGTVRLYMGSMFSGKTTTLIEILRFRRNQAICFKPSIDNRSGSATTSSHNGFEYPSMIINQASEIFLHDLNNITLIGIDEASLFLNDPTLIPTVRVLRDMGFDVVISGLELTSEDEPFGQMGDLACISDEVYKLRTYCSMCKDRPASISMFTGSEKGLVKIGGESLYKPVCRTCYNGVKDNE